MDESVVKHLEQPAELDEASKLLLKAADLIEKRGLAKDTEEDDRGRLCAIGALVTAMGKIPLALGREGGWDDRGDPIFQSALRRMEASVGNVVACWNNAPARTAEEVVSTMRRVALGG